MASLGSNVDHVCLEPKGRVSRNASQRTSTADRKARLIANRRSFVATARLNAALVDTGVHQIGGVWCHVTGGKVVARFDSVGDAVAALG